jgi:penicillin-binding protein 1A
VPSLFNDEQEPAAEWLEKEWRAQDGRKKARSPRGRKAMRWMRWVNLHGPEYASRRLAARATFTVLLGLSAVFGALVGLMLVYSIDLPQMEDLAKYRPDTTTELLDVKGREIGSFALERRVVVPYTEFPPVLREAIISIEDKTFERNWGVNLFRAVGAAWRDIHSRSRAQGSSTLTMQLARNLFLSSEKTYGRKIQEILLAMQIERVYTKDQIFALYANQIYLGRGTYGFEAASEYYFSKHVGNLTLAEAALLAALPKGAEYYSPVNHPQRALERRNLVLREMRQDGKITAEEEAAAAATPLGLKIEPPPNSLAPYFVEEVRKQLEREFGEEEAHGAGLRVYTTLDLDLQTVANKAVLDGTAAYERRHGWKSKLENVVDEGKDLEKWEHADWAQSMDTGGYYHGLVMEVAPARVVVKLGVRRATMAPADWAWTGKGSASGFLRVGDVVYVRLGPSGIDGKSGAGGEGKDGADGVLHAQLEQDTGVQASMMAVDNASGEVLAMVGGRDFAVSQFNRATQSEREVGSSFKPYVYTTAVEAGAKPTDTIVDGPVSFYTPNGPYTPHNYEGDYKGTMTLLSAFAESRNIPALKLADKVGIRTVIETAHRFGVTSNIPAYLPVAIGSADISLFEQVQSYSVFPNDGIRIEPHYIRRVAQADGMPLDAPPPQVNEVISVATARTMMELLQAVTRMGTAAAASSLNHPLGGKTGTTNDYTDAWFIGFSPSVTCGTWIGYDDRQSLGSKETGAKAALPMWMDFMRAAIAGKPDEKFPVGNMPKKQLDVPLTPAASPVVEAIPKAGDDAGADGGTDGGDSGAKDAPKTGVSAPEATQAPVGAGTQ